MEVDILRSTEQDVADTTYWNSLVQQVKDGLWRVVICTPPCHTHSRARYANTHGPAPVRSKRWPLGFPWLSGKALEETRLANLLIDRTFEICNAASTASAAFLIEHPEDLGLTASNDQPASIFADPRMFALATVTEAETAAFFQCPFLADTSKPTRVVSTLPLRSCPPLKARLYFGWPSFSKIGSYRGPLPAHCEHKGLMRHKPLLGRSQSTGTFRTSAAAAYPAAMCAWLASLIISFCVSLQPKEGAESQLHPFPPPPPARVGMSQADIVEKPSKKLTEDESDEDEAGHKKPLLTDHLPGSGQPLSVRWGGRTRDFHDGSGLCSPGRWLPQHRLPCKWPRAMRLRLDLTLLLRSKLGDLEKFVYKLTVKGSMDSPFDDTLIANGRRLWCEAVTPDSDYSVAELMHIQEHQPFLLNLLGESLRLCGDPDHRIFSRSTARYGNFTTGVAVGLGVRLPRTPALYEPKTSHRQYDESDLVLDMRNYVSAAGPQMSAVLEAQFQEEKQLGFMFDCSLEEAQALYPTEGTLRIAAQAAIQKDEDTFRILHDATHGVRVNNETKVRDRMRMPTAGEARTLMQLSAQLKPGAHLQLLNDVSKAHRRFLHRVEDWGLLACRSGPDLSRVWLNRVGTFGFTAASYWWGRLISGISRLSLYFFCRGVDSDWLFALLFADDVSVQSHGAAKGTNLVLFYFLWVLLGVPFSWKKQRGGLTVEWVGYMVDYYRFEIGISESRALWLIAWGRRILRDHVVLVRTLAEGLGRFGYCAGVLEWCRPFLAPLYSWSSAAPSGAILPVPGLVQLVLHFLVEQLEKGKRMTSCRLPTADLGELFRTDSKGTEDRVVLGGWEVAGSTPPGKARWFSTTLRQEDAFWLFERGHASRTIASSELLATLIAVFLFIPLPTPEAAVSRGLMKCSAGTDNKGNMFVVNKMLTTKLPLSAVLMQLAVALAARNLWLDVAWIPRESNVEADSLTNDDFSAFDPALRIPVIWEELPTEVMASALAFAQGFQVDLLEAKAKRLAEAPLPPGRKKRKTRFDKSPWSFPLSAALVSSDPLLPDRLPA